MFKHKRQKKQNEAVSSLKKNTKTIMNYTPVPYRNTTEFDSVSTHRESWAKSQIKGINELNEASAGIIDSKIDAQVNLEIANAKQQAVGHYWTIKDLYEASISEIQRSKDILENLLEDLKEDKEDYEKYKFRYEELLDLIKEEN